jgi:hypothetical protein
MRKSVYALAAITTFAFAAPVYAELLVTGFIAGASCAAEDGKGRCVEYGESTGVTCDPGYTLADPSGGQADCIKISVITKN